MVDESGRYPCVEKVKLIMEKDKYDSFSTFHRDDFVVIIYMIMRIRCHPFTR